MKDAMTKSLTVIIGLALLAVGCGHAGAHQLDRNLDRGRIELQGNPAEARESALLLIRHHCGDLFHAHEQAGGSELVYRCGTDKEDIDTELPPALAVSGLQR